MQTLKPRHIFNGLRPTFLARAVDAVKTWCNMFL